MTDSRITDIIEKANNGERLTWSDCLYILNLPETSYEAAMVRAAADRLIREKNDNGAIIIAQVGVDIHPCEAKCRFCSFCEDTSETSSYKLGKPELKKAIDEFCREGDLFGLYLMTMADTDQEFLIDRIRYAREAAPAQTQIWINTGDNDLEFYKAAAEAGAVGAYHVCRLREGKDTNLDVKRRVQTMANIKEAGLDLFSCCEPIGPEHTPDELADEIMRCVDMGVTQFGAMRRIAVPGSPLESMGQISNLKMAHVMGCVGLVYASVPSAKFFGIHEPSELGYLAGANFVTAETGANPRDVSADTSNGRGWDIYRCRKHLFECGFDHLLRGDGTRIPLNFEYLKKTDSLI